MSVSDTSNTEQGSSLWKDAWLRLSKHKASMWSFYFLIFVTTLCFILPFTPLVQNPNVINLDNQSASPSGQHWFGTDHLGRDLFARVLYGGRISLLVGMVSTSVAVIIGIIYGAISGYAGGKTDAVMMRLVDILFALPLLVLVILFAMVVDEPAAQLTDYITSIKIGDSNLFSKETVEPITTLIPLFIAIGAIGWLTIARIVRTQVMAYKKQEFVDAAVSLGLSKAKVLFKHILPNIIGPVIIYTTLAVPGIMLLEATLSFLGLGVKPPNSSWGILIKEGADRMEANAWILFFPALFFSLTLFALNFLGDGLRDALDPKASKD